MPLPRVYADFQNLDDQNRLRLTCAGTLADLQRQGIQLAEHLALTLYTDDGTDDGQPDELRADGVVQFNAEEQCWVASIDWAALRHASAEAPTPASAIGLLPSLTDRLSGPAPAP